MRSSGLSQADDQLVNDQPYRGLWAAVLYSAIADLNRRSYDRGARNYVYNDETGPGSMRWICDMLDLDYDRLQMLSLTREGRRQILKKGTK